MARRLRIQYSGARYHVINRGNMQHDVFATGGAANAFFIALDEAAVQFGWKIAIAQSLRTKVAAPYRWIAMTLKMGHPAAVRGYLSKRTLQSAD